MTSKLKEAREASGYSIDYIADNLNIRKQYLIALEEEDYDSIPGKIYVDGYTKMYYDFLGIKQAEHDDDLTTSQILSNSDTPITSSKYKKYIIICSVILLVLVVVSYNTLKSQTGISIITSQPNDIDDGSKQETFDGSDKTD